MKVEICNAYSDNERCGGCPDCMLMQAQHAAGLQTIRAQKAEKSLEKEKIVGKDICAAHRGRHLNECPYCRIEELIAESIQKNSEYQIMLKLLQAYVDNLIYF